MSSPAATLTADQPTTDRARMAGVVRTRRRGRLHRRQVRIAILLLAPFCAALVLFQYYAIGLMVRDSFFSYSLLNPRLAKWVGLGNFRQFIHDSLAINSLAVTALFAVGCIATQVPLGLLLAVYLNRKRRSSTFLRTVVFSPVVLSVVVVSTMWTFILAPTGGLADGFLNAVGLPSVQFLTKGSEALPSMVLMTLWEEVGFAMILYLAGLQAIPRETDEAALVDGATPRQRFWYVTLPLLRRTTVFVVVTATVFSFQAFAQPYVMTDGGPNGATNFIVYDIYRTAFVLGEPGYGSALSVVLLLIVVVISLIQMRTIRSRVR